jgi:hypothetical protein
MKKKLGLKVLGLVVFSLLLAVNCAEEGTAPETNIPPNTFITNYQIALSPDSATTYFTRIYWSGSDVDGAIFWYDWRITTSDGSDMFWYVTQDDGTVDTVNISNWQHTNTLSLDINLDFPTYSTEYVFYVRAQDNDRVKDPTPAMDFISVERVHSYNYPPDTRIVDGPPDGTVCGEGIHFVIRGDDIDGVIDDIAYKLDGDVDWTLMPADIATGILTFNLTGLQTGARTVTFAAVDNFGAMDPTPVSTSVIVVDTLAPEIALSIKDGQSFIVPFTEPTMDEFTITFTATVDFYYSAIDSFLVLTSEGDDMITTEAEFTFMDIGAGDYWINITAYDIGGNWTNTGQVNFSVVELPANNGLLCVNGVSWADYSQAVDLWDNGSPWGNRTHFKCWDLFDTTPFGSVPVFADSLLGAGSIPTWMFDTTFFEAIVWMGNEYSGDFQYYEERETEIMDYLAMGGNVLLPPRYGEDWFFDDLSVYCGIVDGSWQNGLGPDELTAVYDSLTNITAVTDQSLWDIPQIDGSNGGLVIYEAQAVYPGGAAGFVIMPNGAGGGGAFCYVAGRSYRWNQDELKSNFDVILRYFFGVAE